MKMLTSLGHTATANIILRLVKLRFSKLENKNMNKNIKTLRYFILTSFALSAIFLPSAYANHRTGSLALPEIVVAGDWNGDGNVDLAVNVTGFDNVAIFRGDGQGGFSVKRHIMSDTLNKGLTTGDFNRDGHLDLVTCTAWGYDLDVYEGDGSGGFTLQGQLKGDGEPTRLFLKDMNHDGSLDIIVNAPDEGLILIYFGDDRGNFVVPAEEIELEDLGKDFDLSVADFDSDGNLDIAATDITSNGENGAKVVVFLGDGSGGFFMRSSFAVNPLPTTIDARDLNNDGKPDMVVAGALPGNHTGNFLSTYLGDGTGIFHAKQTIDLDAGNLKGLVAVGDFNEDGNLDVAYPVTGTQTKQHSTTILVFFGDGTGSLVAGPVLTVGQEPHTVITEDFNHDGHLDLVNTNRTDGTISVLLGDGHGNFSPPTFYSVLCDTCLE
jgi:hypothetical protein